MARAAPYRARARTALQHQSEQSRHLRPAHTPDALRLDVAALLGSLLRDPVKPRWGRWLPPWAFRAINARFQMPENCDDLRSELKTGRLRLVHYLAEIAGLISLQNGAILPPPADA